jgi:predicted RNA-binding Zn-ribbon protein involved in translation (DUF1610 family)
MLKLWFWAFLAAFWLLPGALADDRSVQTDSDSRLQATSTAVSSTAKVCPKCHGGMEIGTFMDVIGSSTSSIPANWSSGEYDYKKRSITLDLYKKAVRTNTTYVCESCGYAETYFNRLRPAR